MNPTSNDPGRAASGKDEATTSAPDGQAELKRDVRPIESNRLKSRGDGREADATCALGIDVGLVAVTRHQRRAKATAALAEPVEVDLDFRPKTYFWRLRVETHLLARVKGAERKSALQQSIAGDHLDAIPEVLAQSALSEADRRAIGAWHPAFMGGEYLPDLKAEEVIIARVTIASTTQDVTCVYARRGKDCIDYEVVDEYSGGTLIGPHECTLPEPLTLRQLEAFFNGAWSIFEVLEENFAEDGYVLEEMLDFVRIDSEFYPELDELYRARITAWAAQQRAGTRQGGDSELA
jgi:hypothetical protein